LTPVLPQLYGSFATSVVSTSIILIALLGTHRTHSLATLLAFGGAGFVPLTGVALIGLRRQLRHVRTASAIPEPVEVLSAAAAARRGFRMRIGTTAVLPLLGAFNASDDPRFSAVVAGFCASPLVGDLFAIVVAHRGGGGRLSYRAAMTRDAPLDPDRPLYFGPPPVA
jgi:hypothetical protein